MRSHRLLGPLTKVYRDFRGRRAEALAHGKLNEAVTACEVCGKPATHRVFAKGKGNIGGCRKHIEQLRRACPYFQGY